MKIIGKKISKRLLINTLVVIIFILFIAFILSIAPNYIRNEIKDKTNLIINNNNVTAKLKKDVIIDDSGNVFISKEDATNYFDKYLDYDKDTKNIVTTSDTKVAKLKLDDRIIKVNGTETKMAVAPIEKNGTIYLPFSEMEKVYNIDLNYIKDTNRVIIDSLDREFITVNSRKNLKVKYKDKKLSSTVEKIKKGDELVWISKGDNDWVKVRTKNGKIGYIKEKDTANQIYVRQKMEEKNKVNGKVNLVWDYYSEYVKAPNREGTSIDGVNVVSPAFFSLEKEGKGNIVENIGDEGRAYIEWAKANKYQIWPMVSNNSLKETTTEIMKSEELRENLIDNIVREAVQYELDGINIDFENMYSEDKDLFSKFIIELAPRLKDCGIILSVDVTAPDGSETWSLCFDRNIIGDVADYIVFMAYDQYGISSKTPGTTAGYNWVETNINKFLNQEDVKKEKIILGIPLYTRMWKETDGKITSSVVNMNQIEENLPPESTVERKWNDELKQYYVEYKMNNTVYRMWIEDEKSITEKLNLIKKYELAGAAFWEKDRETENVWQITKNILKD